MTNSEENIEDIWHRNQKLILRLTVFGIVLSSILIAIYGILHIIFDEKDQHLDHEEAIIEYADDDTRLAGVQYVKEYGINDDQYEFIRKELNDVLTKAEPDSKYFEFVDGSIEFYESDDEWGRNISDEEKASILSALSYKDSTTTTFGPEGSEKKASAHITAKELNSIQFKMLSSNNNIYYVKLDSGSSAGDMMIEISNENGERI